MLTFDTDFPGGNGQLLALHEEADGPTVSFLAQSKMNEPQPNWFYFQLHGVTGRRVKLHLANATQCLDCFGPQTWATNHPVYRAAGEPWQRVDRVTCELDEARCYQTTFEVPVLAETMEVAFCYPYLAEHMTKCLVESPALRSTVIGYSNRGRPIQRIFTETGDAARPRPGIYILGRQHSGEVSGAWIIDGMLRYLAAEEGRPAREKAVWWLVPIVDVDGVTEGCYGKDQIWNDFNRAWGAPFPKRTELHAIHHDMEQWQAATQPALVLDMHSPAHDERGMYFVIHGDVPEAERAWLEDFNRRLNEQAQAAGLEACTIDARVAGDNSSAQSGLTAVRHARQQFGARGCVVETSYQGPTTGGTYSIEDYQTYGKCFVKAVAAML